MYSRGTLYTVTWTAVLTLHRNSKNIYQTFNKLPLGLGGWFTARIDPPSTSALQGAALNMTP